MADVRMVARLADSREFAELIKYVKEREEEDVKTLARTTYKHPEEHERLDWEKLKARYAGVFEVLNLPVLERDKIKREESQ